MHTYMNIYIYICMYIHMYIYHLLGDEEVVERNRVGHTPIKCISRVVHSHHRGTSLIIPPPPP